MIKSLVGRMTKLPTHSVLVLGFGNITLFSADDARFQLEVWNMRICVNVCDWDTCTRRLLDFQMHVRCNFLISNVHPKRTCYLDTSYSCFVDSQYSLTTAITK